MSTTITSLPVAELTIAAYLTGYLLRLPCVTALAKIEDNEVTRGYFVEEVARQRCLFLVTIPLSLRCSGRDRSCWQLRQGFADLFVST